MAILKVSIGVVLHEISDYLRWSLPSLISQDYPDLEILIRDQSPKGEVSEWIQKELPEVFAKIRIDKDLQTHDRIVTSVRIGPTQ